MPEKLSNMHAVAAIPRPMKRKGIHTETVQKQKKPTKDEVGLADDEAEDSEKEGIKPTKSISFDLFYWYFCSLKRSPFELNYNYLFRQHGLFLESIVNVWKASCTCVETTYLNFVRHIRTLNYP